MMIITLACVLAGLILDSPIAIGFLSLFPVIYIAGCVAIDMSREEKLEKEEIRQIGFR